MFTIIKSTVAVTYELDNVAKGASELAEKTREDVKLQANSFGLLLCDSDVDHAAFLKEIRRNLDIPVVGFSSTAMLTGRDGLIDTSASLMTVTSDDVFFSVATSEPLTLENVQAEIERTYAKAKTGLNGEPLLVMAFPPYILGIMLDIYPRELDRVSGGLPVFGGLPAHDEQNGRSMIYCGDTVSDERLTILLIAGAVKPVMTVKNSLSTLVDIKRTVTRSDHNVIYRVGDDTFVEFLEQFGLDVSRIADAEDRTTSFTAYPLLVEKRDRPETDGVPIVRTLHCVDLETGSGTAIGEVPEGSVVTLGALKLQDIELSARKSAEDIRNKIKENEADGYRYSAIFAVSCVARYYVMALENTLETDVLKSELPQELSLCGFYSFGEICPTSIRGGKAMNAAHNESLVLLAL